MIARKYAGLQIFLPYVWVHAVGQHTITYCEKDQLLFSNCFTFNMEEGIFLYE
ncbi:MAG: hypothetical protein AAGI38_22225 [Bacteroidota bacterium]